MCVLPREQRSWEDFRKEYLATESIIQSSDMIPIHRPRGKVRSWREKAESVILSETLVLQVTRTLWPKTASKDQRKSGNPQQK